MIQVIQFQRLQYKKTVLVLFFFFLFIIFFILMSGLNRREYKKNNFDNAIDDASQIIKDEKNWKNYFPELIEKLNSDRLELRISSLKSILSMKSPFKE